MTPALLLALCLSLPAMAGQPSIHLRRRQIIITRRIVGDALKQYPARHSGVPRLPVEPLLFGPAMVSVVVAVLVGVFHVVHFGHVSSINLASEAMP